MPRREQWLKGFLFFACLCWKLFEFRSMVRFVKLSYELEWTCWIIGLCRCLNMFSTDWFWQNTAGASTSSTQKRKEQMAPQICLKSWASGHSWKTWIFPTVIRSQQQHGKKFVVPSGSTWRRQISHGASQREMVEGFSCFLRVFINCLCWKLLEFRFIVRIGKLSYESELTKMCLKWLTVNLELLASSHLFQQIDSDKTLQVLRPWHERSRWRRRFAWNLEPVVPAGRVGS